MPRPVPKLAGCGGMAARATTEPDVSGTSSRTDALLLGTGTGCIGPAEATFVDPALTMTVFTRTGFIGSEEPGIVEIAWVSMTPLVKGAGSGLACFGGSAAAEAAISERAR